MKRLRFFSNVVMLAVAVMSTSCVTSRRWDYGGSLQNINSQIYAVTVADLKVDSVRTESTIFWPSSTYGQMTRQERMQQVEAQFLDDKEADVIVDPRYRETVLSKGLSITVSGYPAVYRNFHPATADEASVLNAVNGFGGKRAFVNRVSERRPSMETSRPIRDNYNNFMSWLEGTAAVVVEPCQMEYIYYNSFVYGHPGQGRWGWYARGEVADMGKDSESTFLLAGGAILNLSPSSSLLIGSGFGSTVNCTVTYPTQGAAEVSSSADAAVPIDMLYLWRYRRFNLLTGVTLFPAIYSDEATAHVSLGLGFNF